MAGPVPASLLGLFLCATVVAQEKPLLLRAAKVLTMEGPPILDGEVLVQGGKIRAVGKALAVPKDTTTIQLDD